MFPFWEVAVAPVLEAAEVTKVTEIGALAGQNTELMLTRLGPGVELHVIDPVPQFDPSVHEKKFKGQYIFHRALSLEVLPTLEPMDAVLLDGDHNWYTVYNELRQIAEVSRAAGAPLPVLILHDVCFPYGRRDLYYAPEQIPAEYRQPHAQQGMVPARPDLIPPGRGGLNPTMHNALHEGGPRNGVMTGLDDFVAGYEKPLRTVVLPIYFGLAIVVEEERLERQPALARVLDELEGVEKRTELLELAESTRIQNLIFQHNVFYRREKQLLDGAERYVRLLKGALLDDHYFENELRLDYLVLCLETGRAVQTNHLRDPARLLKDRAALMRAARESGGEVDGGPTGTGFLPYTDMGRARLDALHRDLDTIRHELVQGDLVECGTGRGGGAVFMRGYLEAHAVSEPTVWVADGFLASRTRVTPSKAELKRPVSWYQRVRRMRQLSPAPGGWAGIRSWLPSLGNVRQAFATFDLLDKRVKFLQGPFSRTLGKAPIEKVALLRIGTGSGEHAEEILDALYDKVSVGGFVVVDDYGDPDCRRVVEEFRARRAITDRVERTDHRGARWRKLAPVVHHAPEAAAATEAPAGAPVPSRDLGGEFADEPAAHDLTMDVPASVLDLEALDGADEAPQAEVAPDRRQLSVVVVFYNMKREAERTLHSLTRTYQQGVDDLDYEVVVVENGSAPDQRLGAAYVESFGPQFRYIDMGDDAVPSPVPALNRGIAAATGEHLALMIDGAHVLTPGVLRHGMAGLTTYAPAVVATQQWYVGPGQQGELMNAGYDRETEDRLFERIDWPVDGYRLFRIGHFVGERDWFDGLWESNCLFTPRALLEQSGGFDESFDMPGGGYANLDIFERLSTSPGVHVVTMVGEGSFHQLHQGTTTNQTEVEHRHRLLASYRSHYEELRGRDYLGPGKDLHFVGKVFEDARRTKARRQVARTFWEIPATGGPDGPPSRPEPMPQEVSVAFTEAFWRSLAWKETTWLGHEVGAAPSDLVIYQELLTRVRPDWVVVTHDDSGGRALFLASICELLGHGRVLSVGKVGDGEEPDHARIECVEGDPTAPEVQEEVRRRVDGGGCLVLLGGPSPVDCVLVEFEAYAPLVPVGSYVIVEGSIVNGAPVWPGFGPGPVEALKRLRASHPEFMADLEVQKYSVTFNPEGYLKRLS